MADFKIVYTDNVFGNNLIEKRRYKDVAFKYVEASDFDEDTLKKECADADAVVCCYAKITSSVIDAMKKCKVIVKAGMGVNNRSYVMDILKELNRQGKTIVVVTHAPYVSDCATRHIAL